MATDPSPRLRPDWVLRIARAVNTFAASSTPGSASPKVIAAFIAFGRHFKLITGVTLSTYPAASSRPIGALLGRAS